MEERGKAFFRLDTQKQNDVTKLVPVLEKSGESIDDLKHFLSKLESIGLSFSELTEGLQQLKANELSLKRLLPDHWQIQEVSKCCRSMRQGGFSSLRWN